MMVMMMIAQMRKKESLVFVLHRHSFTHVHSSIGIAYLSILVHIFATCGMHACAAFSVVRLFRFGCGGGYFVHEVGGDRWTDQEIDMDGSIYA
ncbi:hypothetical protein CSUI_010339, partial [Cystoisospora suis]